MSQPGEGYQRVATLQDVPEGGCLAVDLDGRPVVLVRHGDTVHALENCCPHAGAPLSEGIVEGGLISCAWHGWTFELSTGASADQPGLAVPRLDALVVDGEVWLRP